MKEYRKKEMKYLLIAYSILLILFCTNVFEKIPENIVKGYNELSSVFEGVAFSSVIYIIVLLGDSVISADTKGKLIGLFFIPRAGHTIFSRIKNNKVHDLRFSNSKARESYQHIIADIPNVNAEKYEYENSNWYKLYKQNKDDSSIEQAQKDYLMCRDLNIETFEYLIFYLISVVAFKEYLSWSWKFFYILLFMLAVTNIATHNKMNRFVNTVISVDLAKNKGECKE